MKQEGKDILVIEDNTIYEIDWECMHNRNGDCGKQEDVWKEKPVKIPLALNRTTRMPLVFLNPVNMREKQDGNKEDND